jgi:hypothetical protein
MCGGDIYYYGSSLVIYVNDQNMKYDEEYFLGYYQSNKIDFVIRIKNIFTSAFNSVYLEAIPFESDSIGYTLVKFSSVIDVGYVPQLYIESIPASSEITVYGRIFRDDEITPSDINPFKFNLKITNS